MVWGGGVIVVSGGGVVVVGDDIPEYPNIISQLAAEDPISAAREDMTSGESVTIGSGVAEYTGSVALVEIVVVIVLSSASHAVRVWHSVLVVVV